MDLSVVKERIEAQCQGWSGSAHWSWQRNLLAKVPSIRDICILGVYHGRDTAYAAALLREFRGEGYHITAVDLFQDDPCEDWPDDKRALTWEEAGFGKSPTLERAQANLDALGLSDAVTFLKRDAVAFLEETDQDFDLIYIDTSHDYESTRKTIEAALPRLRPLGMLSGDDFSDQGTWGVERAVRECCTNVRVYAGVIWYAAKCEFKGFTDEALEAAPPSPPRPQ